MRHAFGILAVCLAFAPSAALVPGAAFRRRISAPQRHLFGVAPARSRTPAAAAADASIAAPAAPKPRGLFASRLSKGICVFAFFQLARFVAPAAVDAMAIGGGAAGKAAAGQGFGAIPPVKFAVWLTLFVASAAFHSAETAITTLYPWKVREFAEEEGPGSPFSVLSKDITRVLTTILLTTTACTIYSAALFTSMATVVLGQKGIAVATVVLTIITVFFGELLPKALGVSSAERVARRLVPPISALATVMAPLGMLLSTMASGTLRLLGFKNTAEGSVSEEELRLIVSGARQSGGIESEEGAMIENVLDLADTRVSEVMRPRVELVALDLNDTLVDVLDVFNQTKYSRFPVYEGEIDNIRGVALTKDLLQVVQEKRSLSDTTVKSIVQSTYFVPETMPVWSVLEEMRRRRLHMAIVVDEYGGTAGLVTLEDILEEVVGEIYDEEDEQESRLEEAQIVSEDEAGSSYLVRGSADLEDVAVALGMTLKEEDERDFGTISGFICAQAGEIPAVGDVIIVDNLCFTILESDERRILTVRAETVEHVADHGPQSFDAEMTREDIERKFSAGTFGDKKLESMDVGA